MARRHELQGEDLARPARELPLKTIKTLGYLLHSHLHNSGNWETVAEDLGYCYEAIKQFSTNANVRQDCTPGELMLRDWIGRGTGRTLFVLRNALNSSDRRDCVEFLDQEIKDKILHMDLQVCIADPNGSNVNYQPIRTKSDASLRDSLQNILDGPIRNYQLADSGASWDSTIARQYKGQELKIYRLKPASSTNQEQDPTVDSSSHSLDDNVEMQDPCTQSNELDRTTQRVPAASHRLNLNIPAASVKKNNVPKVDSSKPCYSCTCQVGTQTTPTIVKRSITIYDDQELTMQEIKQITQRPGTMKLDTSSLLESQNSVTLCKEPNDCVRSSSDVVVGRSYRNSDTFRKVPNYCIASSSNVVMGQSYHNSDTFCKEPNCAPSSSDAVLGQSYRSLNMDSLTSQKQIVDSTHDRRNIYLGNNSGAHLNKNMNDSITKQKEILKCCRNVGILVDYTPSSSSSGSEKLSFPDSLNQGNCTQEENGRFSTTATAVDDHAVYSYAVYHEELESRVHGEKFMYAVESHEADSSMDTQVINDQSDKEESGITFVNTESVTEEQYQDFQGDNFDARKGINSGNRAKNCSFPSEMDCQCEAEVSEYLSTQTENTHMQFQNNNNSKKKTRCHTDYTTRGAKNCKTVTGWDLESSEVDDPTYTEQLQTENTHLFLGSKASSADIADLVDDSAICVVDNAEINNFNDLVDDSAICVVKDDAVDNFSELVDDSAISAVNEEFKNASNANIADFVDDSAIHVVNDGETHNTHDFIGESLVQTGKKTENLGMIDIYASSVIPELGETKAREHNSGPKHCKGQGRSDQYERLQRFVSCPNDFGYEEPNKQIRFQKVLDSVEMPTIADSFTPVKEDTDIQDFLREGKEPSRQWGKQGGDNVPMVVHSLDRAKRDRSAIQVESTPNRRSGTDLHRLRQNDNIRRGFFHTNISRHENRPLPVPPVCDLDLQPQGNSGLSRKSPPLLPPKVSKLSPHPYKLVSGGKTSRPMLDQLLANDRLFVHYNSCLQGYPGWSPRETEYTVEKTLQSVMKSDGYYLLWYIRSRKRLALSISHMGKIIHYEVRTKVNGGQLFYYIFPDTVYSDVRLLLQFHESHGLLPQTEQEEEQTGFAASQNARDSRRFARYSHVFMKCPVLVEYGSRLAFSV